MVLAMVRKLTYINLMAFGDLTFVLSFMKIPQLGQKETHVYDYAIIPSTRRKQKRILKIHKH
jgi:hypothetical protein